MESETDEYYNLLNSILNGKTLDPELEQILSDCTKQSKEAEKPKEEK